MWALAARPLVLVFAAVGFLVTWVFGADVDSQAGAYATRVLVLATGESQPCRYWLTLPGEGR